MLYIWGYISKKGAWITSDEEFIEMLKKDKIDFPEKIQGEPKLNSFLEENPNVGEYLIKHFKSLIYNEI